MKAKQAKVLIVLDKKFKTQVEQHYKKHRPAISNFTQAVRVALFEFMQGEKK